MLAAACQAGHCASKNLKLESYIADPCLTESGYCFKAGDRLYQSSNKNYTIVGWDISQRAKPVKILQWTDANYTGWEGVTGTQDYVYQNYATTFNVGNITNLSSPAMLSSTAFWSQMANTCQMLHYPDVMVAKKTIAVGLYYGGFSIVNVLDGNVPVKTYDYNDANMQGASGFRYIEDGNLAVIGGTYAAGGKNFGQFGTLSVMKIDWQTETATKIGSYVCSDGNAAAGWKSVKYTDVTPNKKYALMTAPDSHKVIFMNTSDMNNPSFVNAYTNTMFFNQTGLDPYCVNIAENLAFVNGYSRNAITVLEISDPNRPIVVGYITNATWLDTVDDMRSADGHLYCTIDKGLAVFKIPNFVDGRQRQ